jgi:hypothetical protein
LRIGNVAYTNNNSNDNNCKNSNDYNNNNTSNDTSNNNNANNNNNTSNDTDNNGVFVFDDDIFGLCRRNPSLVDEYERQSLPSLRDDMDRLKAFATGNVGCLLMYILVVALNFIFLCVVFTLMFIFMCVVFILVCIDVYDDSCGLYLY